ncbi:class I SAM-dependent methyltransferase [Pseudalkalibacillus salsuginis]|uniref:class I SAM-dependent methyltransferase n=1 Tax=Pseudalkalibacillus salsuginis TaxID=2910972 RepID=UPI001F393986|nr:methyltransferase domain-containing protein [Pseudalkalibacillus salsuginis]MCF6410066.1 class I SAM-dependent methyltransferase [Pseudalkalibacillus salsuginis]
MCAFSSITDAIHLPFNNDSFEGITSTLAIHHFNDLKATFEEAYRVLNKGRFVIFTSSPKQMNNYWLKEYFPNAIDKSAEQMPNISKVNKT